VFPHYFHELNNRQKAEFLILYFNNFSIAKVKELDLDKISDEDASELLEKIKRKKKE
jgi:phosphoribosylformylglycinamidine (FGAM) synthase PurS component